MANVEISSITATTSASLTVSQRTRIVNLEVWHNTSRFIICRTNAKTNTDTVLAIQSAAINVDDARVEAMISDSVDHAWADMHERQWTEASLKADELLTALDAALPAAGDALSDSDRAAITSAADAVRTARSTSDLNALKAANAALDAATESLAAIIVERAMDAAFERRGLL